MATLSMESATVSNELMVSQKRVIRAPRARVYEAWINPEMIKKWFGSVKSHCSGAQTDPYVGGSYRIEAKPNDVPAEGEGDECGTRSTAAFGYYTKVVADELLQFTWASDWIPGEETLVTVSLKDVAEGTEMTLVHERFQTEASRDAHAAGWAECFAKFAALAEG